MARTDQDIVDAPVFDNLARIHRQKAGAGLRYDAEIMGYEQKCRAARLAQVEQEINDLRLDRDIQRGRRLVGDEQFRLAGKRHGDHRALTHAAGQLVRVFVVSPRRLCDADSVQEIDAALVRLPPRQPKMKTNGLADLLSNREDRVEGGHRLLKDHADLAAADTANLFLRDAEEIPTVE
jgi:hypothetical protein